MSRTTRLCLGLGFGVGCLVGWFVSEGMLSFVLSPGSIKRELLPLVLQPAVKAMLVFSASDSAFEQ